MALSTRQARFVAEFLIDNNATQAAIRSGYSKKGATVRGSELLANRNVAKEINKGKMQMQERLNYTADEWRRDTMRLRELSEKTSDLSNALKAQDMLGKSLGIYSEGRDLTSSDGSMTQKPTVIELVGKLSDDNGED